MRILALFASLALPLLSHAAPTRPDQISGDELVLKFFGEPSQRGGIPKGEAHVDRERARFYMNGIMDLTEGHRWCATSTTKSHELQISVIGAIADMSTERRKTNAAMLVLEVLAQKKPCHPGVSKP